MAKITRPDTDMPIFGSAAVAADLKIFGTATESTAIEDLLTNANAADGWSSGVDGNGFPAKSWFNAVGYTFSYITAYYLQQGVPEWNTNQEYFINAIQVGSDGKLYKSLVNNNSANDPISSPTEWEVIGGDLDINGLTSKTTPVGADEFVIADSDDGFNLKKVTLDNLPLKNGVLTVNNFFYAVEEKPNGQSAGSSVAGEQERILNTVKTNTIVGASLLSNQISLPAGDYIIRASTPIYNNAGTTKAIIHNVTDAVDLAVGQNARSLTAAATTVRSEVLTPIITLVATKVISLRQHIEAAKSFGLGYGGLGTDSNPETYSSIEIWKVG